MKSLNMVLEIPELCWVEEVEALPHLEMVGEVPLCSAEMM